MKEWIIAVILVTGLPELSPRLKEQEAVRQIYEGELGVREASNHNDGTRVETYLHYVGLKKGEPWCAAFVCWVLGQAGIANPHSGYCPNLFPKDRIVWTRSAGIRRKEDEPEGGSPETGDVFGLYFPEKGRIAHVGFIEKWEDKYAVTVEGNTNEGGSREGDGVYCKRRLTGSLYKIARYIIHK